VLLVAALIAGEGWSLLMTAERTIAHREQQQGPLRGRGGPHEGGGTRGHCPIRFGRHRHNTASDRSPERQGGRRCGGARQGKRQGLRLELPPALQAQVDQAADEVKARAEIEAARTGAELKLEEARVGLYRRGRGANAAVTGIEWRDKPLLMAAE
jgi:hypothetical protein